MVNRDSVPRYVVNFYELEQRLRELLLKDIYNSMITSYPQLDTDGISDTLGYIESLMPDVKYKDIKNEIDQFILYKYDGTQQIEGAVLNIPAIRNDYKVDFTFDKDVFLTGLHLNQTGWKKEDKYSLKIDKAEIICNAFTKEIGEHKHFNTYYKVDADTPIFFIFHNRSGNSRQVLVDLEYIQGEKKTIPSNPDKPNNPDKPSNPDKPNNPDIPTAGSTLICLDVSGSMYEFLNTVSDLMVKYLQHLKNNDPVTVCFVAGMNSEYDKGSYYYLRKDFTDKNKAIEFLSMQSNIPKEGGGSYDIVTVQCILDYDLKSFTNYIIATDQPLDSDPNHNFVDNLKEFFTAKQNTFSLPVFPELITYWDGIYKTTGLFKPIKEIN